jgi:hypothetical protein
MEGLTQVWMEPDSDFFERIDSLGGWPTNNEYVSFLHVAEGPRPCYFGNEYKRDEYNTTLFSRDDYLWWKLSDKFKAEVKAKYWNDFRSRVYRLKVED